MTNDFEGDADFGGHRGEPFPGVQVGTFVNGDQWVFRAPNGADFADVVKSVAGNAEDIVTALTSIKQVAVAKGVFTGDSSSGTSRNRSAAGGRTKDSPPPSGGDKVRFYEDEDGVAVASIECSHGPMLDLRGRGYKADLYCSLNTKDYKKKCKPVSL